MLFFFFFLPAHIFQTIHSIVRRESYSFRFLDQNIPVSLSHLHINGLEYFILVCACTSECQESINEYAKQIYLLTDLSKAESLKFALYIQPEPDSGVQAINRVHYEVSDKIQPSARMVCVMSVVTLNGQRNAKESAWENTMMQKEKVMKKISDEE